MNRGLFFKMKTNCTCQYWIGFFSMNFLTQTGKIAQNLPENLRTTRHPRAYWVNKSRLSDWFHPFFIWTCIHPCPRGWGERGRFHYNQCMIVFTPVLGTPRQQSSKAWSHCLHQTRSCCILNQPCPWLYNDLHHPPPHSDASITGHNALCLASHTLLKTKSLDSNSLTNSFQQWQKYRCTSQINAVPNPGHALIIPVSGNNTTNRQNHAMPSLAVNYFDWLMFLCVDSSMVVDTSHSIPLMLYSEI